VLERDVGAAAVAVGLEEEVVGGDGGRDGGLRDEAVKGRGGRRSGPGGAARRGRRCR
jgi:hypothetical protein